MLEYEKRTDTTRIVVIFSSDTDEVFVTHSKKMGGVWSIKRHYRREMDYPTFSAALPGLLGTC